MATYIGDEKILRHTGPECKAIFAIQASRKVIIVHAFASDIASRHIQFLY